MTASKLRRILSWEEIAWLVDELIAKISSQHYDLILVITRGGMVPACLISERLGLRNIVVAAVQHHSANGKELDAPVFWQFPEDDILRDKSVLIIDDVWDSGRTAVAVRDKVRGPATVADLAVLHFKPGSSDFGSSERPEFFAEQTDDWIIYPWDESDSE